MTPAGVSAKLDCEFRKVCKVVLGSELGGIEDYESYLSEYVQSPKRFASSRSGRPVYTSGQGYLPSARFAGFDELDWKKRFQPLGINEIKDIEGIRQALSERFLYAGNVVLGKSRDIEDSTNITDSFFASNSSFLSNCEYVAYGSFGRNCRHIFGSHDVGNSNFVLRSISVGGPQGCSRVFESNIVSDCSDLYYSFSMLGCQKCWFSFFQKGKRYCIGNLELGKDEYARVESSLLEQIRSDLARKKKTLSFRDLLRPGKREKPHLGKVPSMCDEEGGRSECEKAFRSTTKVVLGRELSGLDSYGKWLARNVDFYDLKQEPSAVTGKPIFTSKKYWKMENLKGVFVGEEKDSLSSLRLEKSEIEPDLAALAERASRIAFASFYFSQNCRQVDVPLVCAESVNSYRTVMPVLTKNTAFSFWPRESASIFGSAFAFASNFCIKASYSQNLARAFEVDSAYSSSDIYFCHNVEALTNGMFCFNSKSKRNAIGNAEYPQAEYARFKSALLSQISDELERTRNLKWSIYNIGAI